jgi:hypothetical protein
VAHTFESTDALDNNGGFGQLLTKTGALEKRFNHRLDYA